MMTITINGKTVATGETWESYGDKSIEIAEFDVRCDKVNDAVLESNGMTDAERREIEDQYTIACGTVTDTQHGETFTYDGWTYLHELTTRKATR